MTQEAGSAAGLWQESPTPQTWPRQAPGAVLVGADAVCWWGRGSRAVVGSSGRREGWKSCCLHAHYARLPPAAALVMMCGKGQGKRGAGALGTGSLICWVASRPMAGGRHWIVFKVPSNPIRSVTLWGTAWDANEVAGRQEMGSCTTSTVQAIFSTIPALAWSWHTGQSRYLYNSLDLKSVTMKTVETSKGLLPFFILNGTVLMEICSIARDELKITLFVWNWTCTLSCACS